MVPGPQVCSLLLLLTPTPHFCSPLPLLVSVPHSPSSFFLSLTSTPHLSSPLPLLVSVPHSHSPHFCSPLPLLISAFRFLPLSSAFHQCCPYLPLLPASRRYSSLAARAQRNPAYAVPCHSYNTLPPVPASRRHGSFATRVQHTTAPVVLRQRATFLMPEAPGVGRRGGRVGGGALAARAGRGRYHDTSHPRTTLHPSRSFARYRSTPHALAARAGGGAASTPHPRNPPNPPQSPCPIFSAPLTPALAARARCQCSGQPPSPLAVPSPDLAPPRLPLSAASDGVGNTIIPRIPAAPLIPRRPLAPDSNTPHPMYTRYSSLSLIAFSVPPRSFLF